MRLEKILFTVVIVVLLSACGGGSSSSNTTPTVNAGVDKSAKINETITIRGTASDSDGSIVAYEWREGSKVLADTATFDYLPTVAGNHTLTLTVTDDDGVTASDSVVVTVKEATSTLSNGLIAHYKFDGNANDSSGNGNDGVEHGGVSYVDGVIGKAGRFDGIDDYISLNKKFIVGQKSFTFSIWIKPELFDSQWGRSFYTEQNSNEYSKFNVQLRDNQIQLFGRYNSKSNDFRVILKNNPEKKFYYLVICKNNNKLDYYINGVYINSFFMKSEIYDDVDITKTHIGSQTSSVETSFKGLIDDLRIYNRALNESEIQELYNLKQN